VLIDLGNVLDAWRPQPGNGSDPLVAVRAAWVELVGPDVARAAQPVAIERDALIVLTASSAWSNQLVFLEPQILRGLRALPETPGLTRLRFRVGKLRRPLTARGGPRGPRNANADAPVERPAATLDEALARLRRAIERTRAAHRTAGGEFCGRCAVPVDAGTELCRPCRDGDERRRSFACERLLYEAPWLSSDDVLAEVEGLTPDAYDAIRRRLLKSWWDELWRANKLHKLRQPLDRRRLRKLASSFVLLETRIDPHKLELDSPLRKNALGDLFDFVRKIETEPG
jgi:Dna[CI] antecedent, DciA